MGHFVAIERFPGTAAGDDGTASGHSTLTDPRQFSDEHTSNGW